MWPVKWEKLNNDSHWTQVDSQKHRGGGSRLTIASFEEGDAGEYRCGSKNSVGQAEISLSLDRVGGVVSVDDESSFRNFPRFHPTHLVSEARGRRLHPRRKSATGLEARKSRFRSRMRKMRRFKQKKSLTKAAVAKTPQPQDHSPASSITTKNIFNLK